VLAFHGDPERLSTHVAGDKDIDLSLLPTEDTIDPDIVLYNRVGI